MAPTPQPHFLYHYLSLTSWLATPSASAMTTTRFLCFLVGLSYVIRARAIEEGAFAISIDPGDYYIERGPGYIRNASSSSITCPSSDYQSYLGTSVSIPATGNPLCVTGSWIWSSPGVNALQHFNTSSITKKNTWCWDRSTATASTDRHNITRLKRLDELQIIVEPEVPKG